MKTTSSKTARALLAALALCAAFGTARAQELDEAPATGALILIPSFLDERYEQAAARALAERRQQMIDDCERNHGTECEREVDTELRAEALQSGGRVIRLRPAR